MSDEMVLSRFLLDQLGPEPRRAVAEIQDLDSRLTAMWHRAQEPWPHIAVSEAEYLELLAAKLEDVDDANRALERLDAAEIYIACACIRGDRDAITAFEAKYFPGAQHKLARMGLAKEVANEVNQMVREKLFVARSGRRAKVCEYAGGGALRSLVQVTAYRTAISMLRKHRREDGDQDEILALPTSMRDPELEVLRAQSLGEFKTAFADAIGTLSSRERNILRLRFVDGLTVEHISALYQVHRTTVSRWLSSARVTVATETRRLLEQRLQLNATQLASMMRLVDSQLDMSIERLLKTQDGTT